MRKLALILVVGLAIALLTALVFCLDVRTVVSGYLMGSGWMVIMSVIINSAAGRVGDPAEYGEELAWMGDGDMDGFEAHDEHMRRDRVWRHLESSLPIPSGEPQ